MKKEVIQTGMAPKAVGPYSQAVKAGGFLFTAGQIGIDPASGKLVDGGFEAQVRRVLENLRAVLAGALADFSHVVKATVFLEDISNFAQFNKIYAEYFPSNPPARSAFQVAALPLRAMVEIEMIALLPSL
jgi:2-iminobutanoate/2-iminopropanoate deaminase